MNAETMKKVTAILKAGGELVTLIEARSPGLPSKEARTQIMLAVNSVIGLIFLDDTYDGMFSDNEKLMEAYKDGRERDSD